MFILVQDEDSHWYVIPQEKQEEFERLVNTEDVDWPGWVEQVGGSPRLVKFFGYTIG